MSDAPQECSACHVTLQRIHTDAQGQDGAVSVALHGVPMLGCPQCGVRASLDSLRFVMGMAKDGRIRFARSQGFFSKTLRCCQCGNELHDAPQPRKLSTREIFEGSEVTVEITAPGYRCGMCMAEQFDLGGGTVRSLGQAIAQALK